MISFNVSLDQIINLYCIEPRVFSWPQWRNAMPDMVSCTELRLWTCLLVCLTRVPTIAADIVEVGLTVLLCSHVAPADFLVQHSVLPPHFRHHKSGTLHSGPIAQLLSSTGQMNAAKICIISRRLILLYRQRIFFSSANAFLGLLMISVILSSACMISWSLS